MKKRNRTLEILEHFAKEPQANVAAVAKKYGTHISRVYALRKKAALNLQPEPTLESPGITDVDSLLDDRGRDYGKFIEGAEVMQMLKRIVHNYIEARGTQLAFDQREALDMIMHKVGRIINGNPDKADSWRDVAGYATLVADRLDGNAR